MTEFKLKRTGDKSGEDKATTAFIGRLESTFTVCFIRLRSSGKRWLLQEVLKDGTASSCGTLG